MASIQSDEQDHIIIDELRELVWGSSLKPDVFMRWSQGFVFSDASPTALVQYEGGPCAVIAPVQAFLIKCALFNEESSTANMDQLSSVSNEEAQNLLLAAINDILIQMNVHEYVLVSLDRQAQDNQTQTSSKQDDSEQTTCLAPNTFCQESFHSHLKLSRCSDSAQLQAALKVSLHEFQSTFGVLLCLYSILLSKGIEPIKNEVEDPSEPLIDGLYGHGSQSLINLLLTSQATSNVWDNDKEISGLKLRGIQKQSTIGFLTLMEYMKYCEVGWLFKNPLYPIWILGSETHLTVLFSTSGGLVVRDSPAQRAKLIFSQYDTEGNGFIPSDMLGDLMGALDLVAEEEYVQIMKAKMDEEELGIITLNSFLDEFFADRVTEQPQSFCLYHYNGLPQSCPSGKVIYLEGKAVMADDIETQFITDTSPIKLCIQTKWPSIEIIWEGSQTPSLN